MKEIEVETVEKDENEKEEDLMEEEGAPKNK
jgi:hypothetical protein